MVGEGVLLECLENPQVAEVLSISRKQIDRTHPKLKQLLLKDFSEIENHAEELKNYEGCFSALELVLSEKTKKVLQKKHLILLFHLRKIFVKSIQT